MNIISSSTVYLMYLLLTWYLSFIIFETNTLKNKVGNSRSKEVLVELFLCAQHG